MAKREEYKTALGKRGYSQVESKSTKYVIMAKNNSTIYIGKHGALRIGGTEDAQSRSVIHAIKKELSKETKKPSSNKESVRASKLRKVLEEFEKTTGSLLEQVQLRLKQEQEANENDNETMFELKQIGYAMEKQTRRFLES